jgi:endonuclease III-like uncharacterized protein
MNNILRSLIDLKFFLYSLELEECITPSNFKCRLLGHELSKTVKDNIKNLKWWNELSDGFKFKEMNGICKRCGSAILLYQYPQWPQHVFAVKRCSEKD